MRKTIDFGTVADLYDVFVQWDTDVPFFREVCARASGEVLELMCGTGRLSIPLLQSGVRLCCVDYSREMLAVLDRRLREHHLTADVRLQDVRTLDLGRRFNLILLPFHSFSEIAEADDRALALAAIRAHLTGDGRFVVTLHNPAIQVRHLDGTRRQICDRAIPGQQTTLRVWFTGRYRAVSGIAEALQEYEVVDADAGLLEKRELALRFAVIERAAFEDQAAAARLQVLHLWGDYSRHPFDADQSPYMIWELGHGRRLF